MKSLEELCRTAAQAKYEVQKLCAEEKNRALEAVAEALIANQETILKENAMDIRNGQEKGMHSGLLDRLRLSEDRIKAMAQGLLQIAALPDPVGEVLERFERPNGLVIEKRRVPLGVIGIIYESRPNVTADAFGLCFKSGNAVILKGGSDAIHSNRAIAEVIRKALAGSGADREAIQLIETTDRSATREFMRMKEYVDVLIPRGGAGLIRSVVENSTIPVIETGTGNCHIYVDEYADLTRAVPIILNAKTQRIGVCNACESLVIHEAVREAFLPELAKALKEKNVEIRGDEAACEVIDCSLPCGRIYGKEYLDYMISIKTVQSPGGSHRPLLNRYNTGHSDAILSENEENICRFLNEVDSACAYANASTRFTDGFEFGFGAEIGISTQKLHARGPMGLRELTSYKYVIRGTGQVRQ